MNLTQLLSNHKKKFRHKLIEAIAKKHALPLDDVEVEYKDFIKQYVDEKYKQVEHIASKINEIETPILLNIRRDRMREDKCKLCEANQSNIDEIAIKYSDRIEVIEVLEDKPEGGALYHIIFHEEAKEKKLPLTALISRGEIFKFWAGKTVDVPVYERYIKKILTMQ